VDHRVSKTKEPRAEASELRSQPPTREHRAAAKKVTKAYSSQLIPANLELPPGGGTLEMERCMPHFEVCSKWEWKPPIRNGNSR
jgi:hypothetical protein